METLANINGNANSNFNNMKTLLSRKSGQVGL